MEPKGSLFLRSNHMNYGKEVFVSNWHQTREADPKDYDIQGSNPEGKCLHRSTYNRIGNVTLGELPNSTSHDHMEQIKLKSSFQEQIKRHPMVNLSSFSKINLERELKLSDKVLPRHPPEHGKRYMNTTYGIDYTEPYPYAPREENQDLDGSNDNSSAYKKCHSQFTDTADYRRSGKNTWQDESGIYANHDAKRTVFVNKNPIIE